MTPACETLFYPFTSGQLSAKANNLLFMNAVPASDLAGVSGSEMTLMQWFKPYADALERQGFSVFSGDVASGSYDLALVIGTKSRLETEIYLARAADALAEGGTLVVAAGNKEGAGRLKKMMQALGFDNIAEASKNKARVCWARKDVLAQDALDAWLAQDSECDIADGFISRPGVYGWDKIDKGSAILAEHLPSDLKGHGADFGCGYGYLSRGVLAKNKKVKSLDYIDADARAVALCEKNIAAFEVKTRGRWLDLTAQNQDLSNCYDWIVMNPPFHEGKKTDSDIGINFIKSAHRALRRNGALWMVANNQLPYERVLSEQFWSNQIVYTGAGFKVFCAVK